MRVAMISMHTSPLEQPGHGDAGGLNVYVMSAARHLARHGIAVDIYTRATRPSQGEVVEVSPGVRVINIVAGPFEGLAKEDLPTQLTAFAGGILRFVARGTADAFGPASPRPRVPLPVAGSYDLIHSHYWLSGQVGWLLRDLWGVPLVHTGHTWAAVKNHHRVAGDTAESEARRMCEQQLVDNADVVVVNTRQELADIHTHYDAGDAVLAVVSPGADTSLFTPGTNRNTERARRELGVPLHAKVVAFVGRLQELKGPQVLIRAVAELVRRDPDRSLRALLCGGASGAGSSAGRYRALAEELGVGHRVRFLDPRPPQELVNIYRAADLVAVPSASESFGLVALEAQASGTPVVAARVGGLPIAVADGRTGLLVDGHDPDEWADALERLLDDDDARVAMGERATVWAERFSWDNTAVRLAEIYEKAVAAGPRRDSDRRTGAGEDGPGD